MEISKNYDKHDKHDMEYAKEILLNSALSIVNSNTSQHPFFQTTVDAANIEADKININKKSKYYIEILELFNKINAPNKLFNIYLLLDSKEREILYKDFTFFSVNVILERLEIYSKDGQDNICDMGSIYRGMGHIAVLSIDIKSGLFFFRMDGGSNGYDREANWSFIKECNPSKDAVFKDKLLNMENIFDILQKKENVYDLNSYLIN